MVGGYAVGLVSSAMTELNCYEKKHEISTCVRDSETLRNVDELRRYIFVAVVLTIFLSPTNLSFLEGACRPMSELEGILSPRRPQVVALLRLVVSHNLDGGCRPLSHNRRKQ